MGLFSALFGTKVDAAARQLIREEIDLAEALEAHLHWKLRLRNYMDGKSDEKLDPTVIARDDQCALGRWIHGEAEKHFVDFEPFRQLRADHAQFHLVAASIVKSIQANDRAGAEMIFSGEYQKISHKVMLALAELNELVHQ